MRINRRTGGGGIENSALSDLAFLLIIYFIVIAGFNINRGFLMNLPRKNSTRVLPREEILRFSMDQGGGLFFREQPLTLAGAAAEIRQALAERPNSAVVLTIDGKTPWQRVVSFVELAQQNAVDSFSFKMESPPEGMP
ncbi:MAG: biopolymer transporter ExbD [Treponema sp.]|jgi:biopolymer transport protein ExbD|nr:biopolymer transporter ExbD [Treponema sp.]